MKVVTLKLVSGEEWIAKHVDTLDTTSITLESARKLQLVPNGKGGMGLALTPIVMGNVEADKLTISRNFVMVELPVDADFERQYLQEVSGIQLVK